MPASLKQTQTLQTRLDIRAEDGGSSSSKTLLSTYKPTRHSYTEVQHRQTTKIQRHVADKNQVLVIRAILARSFQVH